jgi:hypothetical protein
MREDWHRDGGFAITKVPVGIGFWRRFGKKRSRGKLFQVILATASCLHADLRSFTVARATVQDDIDIMEMTRFNTRP